MASIVSICNLALTHLGKDRIDTLTEASSEARACNLVYDQTLDALLSAYPWRFARGRTTLSEVDNGRADDWKHAYALPTACVKALSVELASLSDDGELPPAPLSGWPYELEGETVYCDLTPARLAYVKRVTDPTKFSPLFIEALSWHLAARLAMPLTRDPNQRSAAFSMALQTQAAASTADANEERHTTMTGSPYLDARAD